MYGELALSGVAATWAPAGATAPRANKERATAKRARIGGEGITVKTASDERAAAALSISPLA
jgi:hypothetical protein